MALPLLVLVGMWFLMVRPVRQRQREAQAAQMVGTRAVLAQAPEQTTGQMGASCAIVPARLPATCPTSLRL